MLFLNGSSFGIAYTRIQIMGNIQWESTGPSEPAYLFRHTQLNIEETVLFVSGVFLYKIINKVV